jgi:MFS family permease
LCIEASDTVDSLTVALAAVAGLVATVFACVTADRWHRRRMLHHGAWTIAMLLFAVGAFALWWATSAGWSSGVFRVFFTAGAVLNVAWLALGSLALFISTRATKVFGRALALLSAFAIGVMSVAPTKAAIVGDSLPRARDHFGLLPRMLAAIGSGVPALVIFAGTVWSILRLLKQRAPSMNARRTISTYPPGRLVASNVLIALGVIVLSASGSLAGRFGEERAFTITLSVGAVILFVGFLLPGSRTVSRAARMHLTR